MTEQEAIAYIENYGWSATRLGLDREKELLSKLGDPQKKLRFLHVAGSNGKGSTCAMLDAILRATGYRTGLYTSPYLEAFNERIRVNGANIPGPRLAEITARVRDIADRMADHPSQFELVTAAAMEYFYEERCEIVVLEVGMGGEMDATNAIDPPLLSIITNIGLEHTEYLGDTLEKIARTKSGIIKSGSACVCYDGAPEVTAVVREVCEQRGVPLACVDFSRFRLLDEGLEGQRFTWDGETYDLALLGAHQRHNAALVLTAVETLNRQGILKISAAAIHEGLRNVRWPARLEILHRSPLFLLDGGHNPQCAEALAESLRRLLPDRKAVFLTGVLADKDYPAVMRTLLPLAREFVCVTPSNPRALDAAALADFLRESLGARAAACGGIEAGIETALELAGEDTPVVAFGSLYMAGALRSCFFKTLKRFQRRRCLAARRALTAEQRALYSHAVCERLKTLPELQNAGTILSYAAAEDETELSELHRWAEARGCRVAFPVPYPDGRMEALIPRDADGWTTGKYGIRTPVPERSDPVPPEALDAVLVPCVGFDAQGGRLGHGGGYYDRFLSRCPRAAQILTAFDAQRLSQAAREDTDRTVPILVTEQGISKIQVLGNAE